MRWSQCNCNQLEQKSIQLYKISWPLITNKKSFEATYFVFFKGMGRKFVSFIKYAFVDNAGVIPKLVQLLECNDFDIQKEAAWAISNATSGGSPEQIMALARADCIRPLCNMLVVQDVKVVTVALEGLENFLKTALTANSPLVVERIVDCGGHEQIENLQHHANEKIYKRAQQILDKYFVLEEEDGDIKPDIVGNQYGFGTMPQGGGGFNFN